MIGTCRGDSEWKWETDWVWSDSKRETADGCSKIKGADGVRTLESLRGRLLAERQSSKVAKQAAEVLANKVIELEKQLKEEARLRDKAEKRLKLLRKKLDSLKLPLIQEEAEQMRFSEFSASPSSCGSTTTNLAQPDQQEFESKPQQSEKSSSTHQDSRIDAKCSEDDEGSMDNSMALVPVISLVEIHDKKATADFKMERISVGEVLDTLRQARERIEGSLERRHAMMIRVGPILKPNQFEE